MTLQDVLGRSEENPTKAGNEFDVET